MKFIEIIKFILEFIKVHKIIPHFQTKKLLQKKSLRREYYEYKNYCILFYV